MEVLDFLGFFAGGLVDKVGVGVSRGVSCGESSELMSIFGVRSQSLLTRSALLYKANEDSSVR